MEMETLDTKLKGEISDAIEKVIEQKNLVDKASWAVKAIRLNDEPEVDYEGEDIDDDTVVLSPDDMDKLITLAYTLGATMDITKNTIFEYRYLPKLIKKIVNQIEKILGREQSIKFHLGLAKNKNWLRGLNVKVSEEDYVYNREQIAPHVPTFITKINQEYALKIAKGKHSKNP